MKLGIIRCMQTEDYCPGSRDFRTIRERKGAFEGEDDIQLVGFINCGGCPGKKAVLRARALVSQRTPSPLPPVSVREPPSAIPVLLLSVCGIWYRKR